MMKRGFTLVEILIVIAIIALLAGIGIPNLMRMRLQGDIAEAKGDLRRLQTSLESYYTHNDSTYPSTLTLLTSATPKIIHSIPTDVFSSANNSYGYNISNNGDYYIVYSVGQSANGSATVADSGVISESNSDSCIYVSNAGDDSSP